MEEKIIVWIPCSERTPDHDNNVRVTYVIKSTNRLACGVGYYCSPGNYWKVCADNGTTFYSENVIAWKEFGDLPYIPKGKW